jgi:hypothetical protein
MTVWLILVVLTMALGAGLFVLFRSFRRWPQEPPRTPEARAADARLWSKMNIDQS